MPNDIRPTEVAPTGIEPPNTLLLGRGGGLVFLQKALEISVSKTKASEVLTDKMRIQ